MSMFQSPKLFLNLVLIGCCFKRMPKEGPEQPIRALLTKAVATHGRKLQQKAQCFTADSFYQYLSLFMMGQTDDVIYQMRQIETSSANTHNFAKTTTTNKTDRPPPTAFACSTVRRLRVETHFVRAGHSYNHLNVQSDSDRRVSRQSTQTDKVSQIKYLFFFLSFFLFLFYASQHKLTRSDQIPSLFFLSVVFFFFYASQHKLTR